MHLPGEQVQCDLWFPVRWCLITVGCCSRSPVLVMVAGYSRFIAAMMIPSRVTGDHWLGCGGYCRTFGAVPRTLLWDNESGIGRRGRLADGVAGFCGVLATGLVQTRPMILNPRARGAGQRLPADLVPAGPNVRPTGGLQRTVVDVACRYRQLSHARCDWPDPRRRVGSRSSGDARVAAGGSQDRLGGHDAVGRDYYASAGATSIRCTRR